MPRRPAAGPSRHEIARAAAIAFATAAVVLVTVVLPAEYGVDPLGIGRSLGLLELYTANTMAPPVAPAADGPVRPQPADYRLDSRQLIVPSLGSIEFKYELAAGATMLYSWRANAPIDFDFHTEPEGLPPEASQTFERGEAAGAQGVYTAPYSGLHGWYWENVYDADVTVTLDAAGFFSEARLFLPGMPPQPVEIPARSRVDD